jgi:hypothetical protein
MKTRWPPALILHVALWSGLFLTLLSTTRPELSRRVRHAADRPLYSLDSHFTAITDVTDASEHLMRILSAAPEHGRVVVFIHDGEIASSYLGMAAAYLAWPRDVQVIGCTDATVEHELGAIHPDDVAAVVFCKIKPPAWCPPQIAFGPNMRIFANKRVAAAK